ncbi:pyridoxamine 5'-phosphate oxidase family protein [Streptomyces sp. H10-C2]|uniref:pyridoxamine 5'-phosphate oxidase family protein n=1 Tax=unclassified Streptomyces TaxID=2593676 RepID=UPI0024B933A1|nr:MULTISPECIES: pyridoxamine 5'-phosphate oxidase family protein [unclassified Streptomyces]MDJ0343095.1 pyridoxamine 5'-phosphate oxidase family protein [Streptomyces sp. PH10-H1]MDJ0372725.1 pyridoxamine 5'-phosphate oxidase family protein [Streptomyces sp. H10-C2]
MADRQPVTELDARFSGEGATATDWARARGMLEEAEVFWLSTVRPDGRPHVTPLLAVWLDEALHFCTGAEERKALNLAQNAHCALTTGRNSLGEGLDLVVEGDATRVADEVRLQRLADAYETKYGSSWHFDVHGGAFLGDGNEALVYAVAPTTVFGFSKGEFSQTRWRFERE